MTRWNLAAPEHPLCTAFEAQQDTGIAIQLPAFDKGNEIGCNAFQRQAGNEGDKIIGV